jgi:hypothetical protein
MTTRCLLLLNRSPVLGRGAGTGVRPSGIDFAVRSRLRWPPDSAIPSSCRAATLGAGSEFVSHFLRVARSLRRHCLAVEILPAHRGDDGIEIRVRRA